MMEGVTARTGSQVPNAKTKLGGAPLNQFGKEEVLPNSTFTAVVLPSTSTLYASSFIDLCEEPVILHIPSMGKRFFLLQMLDGWTEVSKQSPGTNKNSGPGDYALVGPTCKGTVQPELSGGFVEVIKVPTSSMWIIGRIYTDGTTTDIQNVVNNIYPDLTLTPYRKYKASKTYNPPKQVPVLAYGDVTTAPVKQVASMDACAFFQNLASLMNYNLPVLPQDVLVLPSLLRLGLVVRNNDPSKGNTPIMGTNFDCTENTAKLASLQKAIGLAQKLMSNPNLQPGQTATHWTVSLDVGTYGIKYLLRAIVAQDALGANRAEDAVYGYTQFDGSGAALDGSKNYTMHFDKSGSQRIPPVEKSGFWSLTIYDPNGKLILGPNGSIPPWNAVGQPTIQGHDPTINADGSLDLYLQAVDPGGAKHNNWVPIPPSGGFIGFLRMYSPKDAILNGNWIPPGITPPK